VHSGQVKAYLNEVCRQKSPNFGPKTRKNMGVLCILGEVVAKNVPQMRNYALSCPPRRINILNLIVSVCTSAWHYVPLSRTCVLFGVQTVLSKLHFQFLFHCSIYNSFVQHLS
jgi:hypothetical protein